MYRRHLSLEQTTLFDVSRTVAPLFPSQYHCCYKYVACGIVTMMIMRRLLRRYFPLNRGHDGEINCCTTRGMGVSVL